MRVMAIDYGDARTGLAVSDPTGTIAGEAWTVKEGRPKVLASIIAEEAERRDVGTMVLGCPRNMDGTLGPRAERSMELKAMLEGLSDIPVKLWDERRTTIAAHDILHANGRRMKDHRAKVDAVAATLILEGYLGSVV